ncbi:hypothetical protein Patl1_35020 [Pistacia atlantica]|uniref:Uncharacterized protein n=1 Tax=Pistacia atlantica TaxID=434234 RepID=A0ACC0ZTQ2_9ROSI|nr:hypothetical protein Patl1_35020 [Pistacia atlantica]
MVTQEVEKKSQDTVKVKVTGKTHVKTDKIIGRRECQLITFDLPYLAFHYNQKLLLYKGNEEFDAMVEKLKDGLKVVLEEFHQLPRKLGKDEDGVFRVEYDDEMEGVELSVRRSEEVEERVIKIKIKIHRLVALQASETHFKR